MKKTVLITGSSTGIGKSTALLFAKNGWNVIATMRTPENEKTLINYPNVFLAKLDVLNSESIENAIKEGIKKFGKIDVLVNNAGYGLVGAFEGMDLNQIKKQFDTNVFGLMDVTHKILPHFRTQNSGHIINIASVGGRVTFPLYSIYHGTKWAVEGFSESLHFELKQLGIKIKIIEPGAIKTDFYDRSTDRKLANLPSIYKEYVSRTMKKMDESGDKGSSPDLVAKVIFKAANDQSNRLRYAAGLDACVLLFIRRFLPDRIYSKMVRLALGA